MKNLYILVLALFLICIPIQPLIAATNDTEQTIDELQNTYDQMESLSFDFFQRSGGELTGGVKTGQGNAKLLKSGNNYMRWDYLEPDKQVLISDGEVVSMYFESSNQMIITPATALEADITYGIFTGKTTLSEDFDITEAGDDIKIESIENDKFTVFKLAPKTVQSQIKNIHIWINEDSLIKRIQISDHFDSITTLVLTNILVNGISNDFDSLDIFNFTPPAGTEIIRQ